MHCLDRAQNGRNYRLFSWDPEWRKAYSSWKESGVLRVGMINPNGGLLAASRATRILFRRDQSLG
jgi:hypothetical protein